MAPITQPENGPRTPALPDAVVYEGPPLDTFLRRWRVCGPITVGATVEAAAQPDAVRAAFGRDTPETSGHEWRLVEARNDTLEFGPLLGLTSGAGLASGTAVYAEAALDVPLSRGDSVVPFHVQWGDAVTIWLNGEPLLEHWPEDAAQLDSQVWDVAPARLRVGRNVLRVKVQHMGGRWQFGGQFLSPAAARWFLSRAAMEGRPAPLKHLLDLGVDVNAPGALGLAPLHRAAHFGRSVVADLLEGGADVNARAVANVTPYRLALRAGRPRLAAFLTERGADPTIEPDDPAAQIDALFDPGAHGPFPGAAALVVQDGNVIYARGHGVTDLETGRPVTTATAFYLASVSKPFTSMAVMMLVARRVIRYDEPIRRHFPELPGWSGGVTVRHLLRHTSGIPDYFAPAMRERHRTNTLADLKGLTNADVLAVLSRIQAPDFAPGEQHRYSNSGYVLLAMLVARVVGQPFHVFLREHIFVPHGMRQTLVYDESHPHLADRALGHTYGPNGYVPWEYPLLTAGDGGMFSTVEDLLTWDQALYTERFVKRSTLRAAWSPGKRADGTTFAYGYGWSVPTRRGLRMVGHGGSLGVHTTWFARYPDQRTTVIVLSANPRLSAQEIAQHVDQIVLGGRMEPQREEGLFGPQP